MIKVYNFKVAGVGDVPVSASSWEEARDIIQAYIDKRSLNWVIIYE